MAVPTVQKTKIQHDYDNAILKEWLSSVFETDFSIFQLAKDPSISPGISAPASGGVWDLSACSSRRWSSYHPTSQRLPPRSKEALFNFDELPPFEGGNVHSLLHVAGLHMKDGDELTLKKSNAKKPAHRGLPFCPKFPARQDYTVCSKLYIL